MILRLLGICIKLNQDHVDKTIAWGNMKLQFSLLILLGTTGPLEVQPS
jgi:hypothetical protein